MHEHLDQQVHRRRRPGARAPRVSEPHGDDPYAGRELPQVRQGWKRILIQGGDKGAGEYCSSKRYLTFQIYRPIFPLFQRR